MESLGHGTDFQNFQKVHRTKVASLFPDVLGQATINCPSLVGRRALAGFSIQLPRYSPVRYSQSSRKPKATVHKSLHEGKPVRHY